MSDIRVTSTGEIFYKIDSQIANMLMAALPTVFERVNDERKPAPVVSFEPRFVARIGALSAKPEIAMFVGHTEEIYSGNPDQVEGAFGGKARRTPPAAVVEQYRALLNQELAADGAAIRRRNGPRQAY